VTPLEHRLSELAVLWNGAALTFSSFTGQWWTWMFVGLIDVVLIVVWIVLDDILYDGVRPASTTAHAHITYDELASQGAVSGVTGGHHGRGKSHADYTINPSTRPRGDSR